MLGVRRRLFIGFLLVVVPARIAAADQAPDVPFGLLDRMRVEPFHLSATEETGSFDHGTTSSVTLHVQASTDCECVFSFYGTLPASIVLAADGPELLPARGVGHDAPRTVLGTADVGIFGGGRRGDVTTLWRVGALLPTATRESHAWLASARVGDRVFELPRAAGVRTSVSREYTDRAHVTSGRITYRVEAGVDVATVLALPGNPGHLIPRAGVGMLVTPTTQTSVALDSVVSADPFVDDRTHLRWSAGVTGRYARHHGHVSFIQPMVTLAMVRADERWAASLLVDLTATTATLADGYDP
jgi:hypothetical protein